MKYGILIYFSIFIMACNEPTKQVDTISTTSTTSAAVQEEALKTSVKNYPDSLLLLQNLVEYYVSGQNYDAALASVNQALTKDSIRPDLWDLKSIVAAQKGDTTLAIKSLEKAVGIFPDPQYIIALGALYAETGNPFALEMADALLIGSKAKAEKEAYFIKGLYYSYKSEKEKSIPFFDKSIAASYTFMEAWLEKGLALYDLKKYKDATEVLEKAITIQNNFDKGYYYLGQCYEKLNRTDEAIQAYQMALNYDPNYVEVKDALGRLGIK
jgi:tetratricopeptide (TPR) repeat protein